MPGHVLELRGCTPEPLGNYLKGLGVFRLIAEQADPLARAWWKDGILHILQTKWEASESAGPESGLSDWLLAECQFTPLIAPWQTGTGYLPIGSRKAGGDALTELLKTKSPGTQGFRAVFGDFAATLGVTLGDDPSKWLEAIKQSNADVTDAHLLRELRNWVHSSSVLKWLDAVGMSVSRSGDSDIPSWFPILASGGGEASGQYVVNHQLRLKTALLDDQSESRFRLQASLFAQNQPGSLEANAMGAMYYPSLMKAPNAGQNFLPDPQRRVNPWDFILLLEGTLVWSMAATRRKGVTSERGSFPFYCRSSFGGSMTIGPKEVEGAEQSIANGELWCPIWSSPSTLTEIQRIFGEGRLQIGEKVCSRSLNFALAMKGLGLDRGIQALHRYSLLERSGSGRQTTLLAVPNGCFVPDRSALLPLLSELRGFAESVAANLTDSGQLARRLTLARVEFERAWFNATISMPGRLLEDLIVAAGRLMRELGANSAKPGVVKVKMGQKTSEKRVPPVAQLGIDWWEILDRSDDSPDFRLARAIAGIAEWGESTKDGVTVSAVESIRVNLLPVARRGRSWVWDEKTRSAVWTRGNSLGVNLAAVLRRRLIDAQRGVGEGLPLWSPYGAGFEDLLSWWQGSVDEQRLVDLIQALSLVDAGASNGDDEPTPNLQTGAVWFGPDERPRTRLKPIEGRGGELLSKRELQAAFELPRVYHLLKLCFVGGRLPGRPVEGRTVPRSGDEPFPSVCLDVLSLLEAGRLSEAVGIATRRLRAKGYPTVLHDPDIQALDLDVNHCRRLAAMMLIPVRQPGVLAALAVKPEKAK